MELIFSNQDKYLLLKQLLITIHLAAKGAVLNSDGEHYDLEVQVERAVRLITEIQNDFTIPYGLLRGGRVYIDMSVINAHMLGMCSGTLPEKCWEYEYIRTLENTENLYQAIMHYPVVDEFVKEHADNMKYKNFYDDGREMAGHLIARTEQALDVVRRWCEGADPTVLEQLIMMINGCCLIEFLFNLTNDTMGVEDIPDADIPGC